MIEIGDDPRKHPGTYTPPQFHGRQHGVTLQDRGPDDHHQCISLWTEDDECWKPVAVFSSFWLDELIDTLINARDHLKTNYVKGDWGYEGGPPT